MGSKQKVMFSQQFTWMGGEQHLDVNTERGMKALLRDRHFPEQAYQFFAVTDMGGTAVTRVQKGVLYKLIVTDIIGREFIWRSQTVNPEGRMKQVLEMIGVPTALIERLDLSKLIIHDQPKFSAGDTQITRMLQQHRHYILEKP